jgi:hypothetical protein
MFEGGLYQKSLSHLQQFEEQICDKLSLMEARGTWLIETIKTNNTADRQNINVSYLIFSTTLPQARSPERCRRRIP